MHVRGMCRLALVALARLESGQAKLRETSKGCDNGHDKKDCPNSKPMNSKKKAKNSYKNVD